MPFKILFLNPTHPIFKEILLANHYLCEDDFTSSKSQIAERIHQYDGLVLRSRINIDANILNKATRLKFIAREGVGIEHIDVPLAEENGTKVLTSPEGSRDTVGEHSIGLLLSLMNHLSKSDAEIRRGIWEREANRATEIKGKTIGILGYGNMGQAFAKKVSGFEANVIAFDKYKTGYGDAFAKEVSLEQLFALADILTIHIPYSLDNEYFINASFLSKFKKPIYLVNTARGLVLHTEDLVNHLKSGQVKGAALDVLEYEEQSFDDWQFHHLPPAFEYLIKSSKVVLSPHIAGWSFESKKRHAEVLAQKIIAILKHE